MSTESAVNLFVLYKIIKELSTPFKDTKAFELGLVDEKGKLIKKPTNKKEREAYSYFFRFVFNIKRLMAKVGLDSKIATFAAALLLLKEETNKEYNEKQLLDGLYEEIVLLRKDTELFEEIANTAHANVIGGTGDWTTKKRGRPKVMGKFIDGRKFLGKKKRKKKDEKNENV